ncbi:MAG TPA: hypothetical protein VN962_03490 [Polyangia bacterium]|nr:hypothetical protein [Polyangia bacterium]
MPSDTVPTIRQTPRPKAPPRYTKTFATRKLLPLVKERPGVTIAEAADTLGCPLNFVYRGVAELLAAGSLTKERRQLYAQTDLSEAPRQVPCQGPACKAVIVVKPGHRGRVPSTCSDACRQAKYREAKGRTPYGNRYSPNTYARTVGGADRGVPDWARR